MSNDNWKRLLGQVTNSALFNHPIMPNDPNVAAVNLPPSKPGPKFRVITDQGAEFLVEATEFDLNFNYVGVSGNRLRLGGRILQPTSLPGFVQPEAERLITIPDDPAPIAS